jgi:hypothetical protein
MDEEAGPMALPTVLLIYSFTILAFATVAFTRMMGGPPAHPGGFLMCGGIRSRASKGAKRTLSQANKLSRTYEGQVLQLLRTAPRGALAFVSFAKKLHSAFRQTLHCPSARPGPFRVIGALRKTGRIGEDAGRLAQL